MSFFIALSHGVSRMQVLIGEQIVTCYVIGNMIPGVAYISPDLAEAIKQTFFSPKETGPLKNVWIPHVPKHVHSDEDPTPRPPTSRGGKRLWTKPRKEAYECRDRTARFVER